MFKAFILILVLTPTAALALSGINPQEQISADGRKSALNLSDDIIGGVSTANYDGDQLVFNVQMNLQAGEFSVTDYLELSTQTWYIPAKTTLTVTFRIEAGKVRDPQVKFVSETPDPDNSNEFSKVKIKPSGDTVARPIQSVIYGNDVPAGTAFVYKPQNVTFAVEHLSLSSVPTAIFTGKPFAWKKAIYKADRSDPLFGRNLIREVIYPAVPIGGEINVPPIRLELTKSAALRLNSRVDSTNFVKLAEGSKAKLNQYHYWTREEYLDRIREEQVYVSLSDISLRLASGILSAVDLKLSLRGGSQVAFDSLRILSSSEIGVPSTLPGAAIVAEKRPTDKQPTDTGCTVAVCGNLNSGSRISFGKSVELTTSSNAPLNIQELQIISGSGSLLRISATGISSPQDNQMNLVEMSFLAANLNFGERCELRLGPKALKLSGGEGDWSDDPAKPIANGRYAVTLADIKDAPVLGGRLVITPGQRAVIIDDGSSITATQISLPKGEARPELSGSFAAVVLKIRPTAPGTDGKMIINEQVELTPGLGTILRADDSDPAKFLSLRANNLAASGHFRIEGPFSKAILKTDALLDLRQGNGIFDIESDGITVLVKSITDLSASDTSTSLSFGTLGFFDISTGVVKNGNLSLNPGTGRYGGTVQLTNFDVRKGQLMLGPGTLASVHTLIPVARGTLSVGATPVRSVRLEAGGFHLSIDGPPSISLVRLISIENITEAALLGNETIKLEPASFLQGAYTITGTGLVRIAGNARIPLILNAASIQMTFVSDRSGPNLTNLAVDGNTSLMSGTISVPIRLKLTEGKYTISPSESIDGFIEGRFLPVQPDTQPPSPRFLLSSYGPTRSEKKQPKLFPVNFSFSLGVNREIRRTNVIITTNGLSSKDASSQSLTISFEALAGNGLYKYDDGKLGINDKPTGYDSSYDKIDKYKPYKSYQEMLRGRVRSSCKASAMVGSNTVFMTDIGRTDNGIRMSIQNGVLRFDLPDQSLGPLPPSINASILLLSGCNNDIDASNATNSISDGLERYVRSHPLSSKLIILNSPQDAGSRARHFMAAIISLSFAEALNGPTPKLQFTLGSPRP